MDLVVFAVIALAFCLRDSAEAPAKEIHHEKRLNPEFYEDENAFMVYCERLLGKGNSK